MTAAVYLGFPSKIVPLTIAWDRILTRRRDLDREPHSKQLRLSICHCHHARCPIRNDFEDQARPRFTTAGVRRALRRCDFGSLVTKLDRVERWDRELSLGEQERIAFARLVLHKPDWIFLDEATAALDEESQRHIMSLFDDELKNATLLSIGHRPDLAAYHTRTLQLIHGREGARLRLKPASVPLPPPPRRWWWRFADWWRPRFQSREFDS